MERVKLILLTLICLIMAGCATAQLYEGQKLDRSKVAVIKGTPEWNFITSANVVIKEVDGVEIGAGSYKVEVLPGKHVLLVKCEMLNVASFNRHTLEVDVEAGKTYFLALKVSPDSRLCEGVLLEN
jgi:hypothetical protein